MNGNRDNEKLGRAIFSITYWIRALEIIAGASLVALIVLLIIGKPLWIAPIVGVGVFIIRRTLISFILSRMIDLSEKADKK